MIEFGFSEYQELLRNAAQDFFSDKCPPSLVREMESDSVGYSDPLWKEMAGLGWLGLALPEEFGGQGGTFIDLAIVLEEAGRVLLPSPFFPSIVLGALALRMSGSEQQKEIFLPKIARGETIFTMAYHEPGFWYDPKGIAARATREGSHLFISGTKLFVPYAHISDSIICAARNPSGKLGLFLVDAKTQGIEKSLLSNIASEKQFEVVFNDVRLPEENVLGKENEAEDVLKNLLEYAAVAKCAEMIGGAARVKEMTVDYAKQRIQFGKPIGSFQGVQKHVADMAVDLESARWATYQAAWLLDNGFKCGKEVAVAKAWTNEVYKRIVSSGHQVHGGYSITMDHDIQLYFRRAKAAELAFGDTNYFLKTLGRDLVAPAAEAN
jgi:alkylation response protein AidB-like acyl-CoA dehydrogenase